MKILITSVPFYPTIGGLNPIAYLSAKEWMRRGHEVRLLTRTPGSFPGEHEIEIIREPSWNQMLEHYGWCDVVFQNHVSIHFALPLLWVRRPCVVSMSGWINGRAGNSTGKPSIKGWLTSLALKTILKTATRNIAACAAVAAGNRVSARVIPNPFDSTQFRNTNPSDRNRSEALLFAGRLIADKGVDDLIRAMGILQRRGMAPRAVIAGDGPERPALEELARSESLSEAITFVGAKSGDELRELMNTHRIMVVPSKWAEPIAIVALEAMACGCVIVGSECGGLAVTVGSCGLTYPNGDYESLAERLAVLLSAGEELAEFTDPVPRHLARYHPERICGEYLEELEKAHRDFYRSSLAKP